jgi:hypothetical protein
VPFVVASDGRWAGAVSIYDTPADLTAVLDEIPLA